MSAAETARLVDGLLTSPAVVYGSLPPDARDLDLLLDADEVARVRTALAEQGWVARRRTMALFAGCTARAVDLVDVREWAPNDTVARAIQEQSVPLPGHTWLRAPAEHHRLLVLARRYAEGMVLDEAKAARVAAFGPATWESARREAPSWALVAALESLDAARAGGPTVAQRPLRQRIRPRRTHVVALSGLDGAGKSTHAEHLKATLEALGYDVSIQWTKVARDQWLKALVAPLRGVINLVVQRRASGSAPDPSLHVDEAGETRNYPDGTPPPPDAAKLLRQSSPVVTEAWAFLLAVANGTTHRREVRRKGTRVVICDRYVADTQAHLRYRYGADRSFRLQGTLVHLLSPRPTAAFFLDVSPATARARKPEQFTTRDLERLRDLYLAAVQRFGVTVVDGEQPVEEVAARLARDSWLALGR